MQGKLFRSRTSAALAFPWQSCMALRTLQLCSHESQACRLVKVVCLNCILVFQDKLLQKQHFRSAGVPVADFCVIKDAAAARSAVESYGTPIMLKARR
jgi:phosphoribosylaminoimidazole carboxylase (NCAIR synthetase)